MMSEVKIINLRESIGMTDDECKLASSLGYDAEKFYYLCDINDFIHMLQVNLLYYPDDYLLSNTIMSKLQPYIYLFSLTDEWHKFIEEDK